MQQGLEQCLAACLPTMTFLAMAVEQFQGFLTARDVWNALAVVLVAAAASAIVSSLVRLLKSYLYDPLMITRIMAKQGVRGPPFIPIVGSVAEIAAYEKSFPDSMQVDDYYGVLPTVKPSFHLYFPRFGKLEF